MSQTMRKSLPAKMEATAKGFTAIITAETLDRDGEVVIPSGMNSTEFDANPVLFWNHDYGKPVGRNVGLKRRERDIVGDFVFAQRPEGFTGDFFPEVAASLVAQGVVNSVSIGYVPEPGGIRKASEVDRKKYGDYVHTIYNRWKLLEVSLAPFQANPDALIVAVKKGIVSRSAAIKYFGIQAPKRVVVTVDLPPSSASVKRPMTVPEAVERSMSRLRGSIY